MGRSTRLGPSGPLSTSWNGKRSSGLSGTPMTDERFVWVSSHHEKPRSSGQRPPSRIRKRLPGPASGIALGREHARPQLEEEQRLVRGRRAQLRLPRLEERVQVPALRVAVAVVLVDGEADPVDDVVTGVVRAGVVPRLITGPVLPVQVERPDDVGRSLVAHHLHDVPEGLPELRRAHRNPPVVGRAPGVPVAVHLGPVLHHQRRAEPDGPVRPGAEITVEHAGVDVVERVERIDDLLLLLAAHVKPDEGDRAARARRLGRHARKALGLVPLVAEVDPRERPPHGFHVVVGRLHRDVRVRLGDARREDPVVQPARWRGLDPGSAVRATVGIRSPVGARPAVRKAAVGWRPGVRSGMARKPRVAALAPVGPSTGVPPRRASVGQTASAPRIACERQREGAHPSPGHPPTRSTPRQVASARCARTCDVHRRWASGTMRPPTPRTLETSDVGRSRWPGVGSDAHGEPSRGLQGAPGFLVPSGGAP